MTVMKLGFLYAWMILQEAFSAWLQSIVKCGGRWWESKSKDQSPKSKDQRPKDKGKSDCGTQHKVSALDLSSSIHFYLIL